MKMSFEWSLSRKEPSVLKKVEEMAGDQAPREGLPSVCVACMWVQRGCEVETLCPWVLIGMMSEGRLHHISLSRRHRRREPTSFSGWLTLQLSVFFMLEIQKSDQVIAQPDSIPCSREGQGVLLVRGPPPLTTASPFGTAPLGEVFLFPHLGTEEEYIGNTILSCTKPQFTERLLSLPPLLTLWSIFLEASCLHLIYY